MSDHLNNTSDAPLDPPIDAPIDAQHEITIPFGPIHLLSVEILETLSAQDTPLRSSDAIFACALALGRFVRLNLGLPPLSTNGEVTFLEHIAEFAGAYMQTASQEAS